MSIPLTTAFLVASSIALLITSNPYIFFAKRAKNRAIDPYNIATSEPGSKILGLFPSGYKGKITSNRAEGGGSRLNPYINPESLKSQIMGNKNLALATKGFYEDEEVWNAKKEMNKVIGASNKRRGYAE